jgi:hypothetical protein
VTRSEKFIFLTARRWAFTSAISGRWGIKEYKLVCMYDIEA